MNKKVIIKTNLAKCPVCGKVFYGKNAKKQLSGHIGGAHRKDEDDPTCIDCGKPLIKDKNWLPWAYESNAKICNLCKRKRLRESQIRTKKKKIKEIRAKNKRTDLKHLIY